MADVLALYSLRKWRLGRSLRSLYTHGRRYTVRGGRGTRSILYASGGSVGRFAPSTLAPYLKTSALVL